MMKNLIFLLLLFALTAPGVLAQDVTIEQVNPPGSERHPFSDTDLLDHYANLTGISILQQAAAAAGQGAYIKTSGSANHAGIIQAGTGNTGAIQIAGTHNRSMLNQNGANLLSLIYIEGRSNQLYVNQRDQNLGNLVQILGSGLDIDITQNRAGFRYTQGGNGNPVTITSTARNVPLIIRNN